MCLLFRSEETYHFNALTDLQMCYKESKRLDVYTCLAVFCNTDIRMDTFPVYNTHPAGHVDKYTSR